MHAIRKTIQVMLGMAVSGMYSATFASVEVVIDYVYDDLNRVISAARSDGPSFDYDYDNVTNLIMRGSDNPDSDVDGLTDIEEVHVYGTDPFNLDSDGDGLTDGDEVFVYGADPLNSDTDGDGFSDGMEVAYSSNPLDTDSIPEIMYGDLNGDGVVDVADVLLAQQIVLGITSPNEDQLHHGDVAPLISGVPQPGGSIDINDLLLIQRKALGQIDF